MAKIVHVVGARPQFIKFSAVSRVLARRTGSSKGDGPGHRHVLVHTGQHYDYEMSMIFFEELGIPEPHCHLGVGSGTHGTQIGRLLEALEEYLLKDRPDAVVVYGDTNTTLAGALAAARLKMAVAHVEAGLRSGDRRMPEEQNRVLADHLSSLLFAPCKHAVENLAKEGISRALFGGGLVPLEGPYGGLEGLTMKGLVDEPLVANTGDIMYDCLLHALEMLEDEEERLGRLGLEPRTYAVLTIHREDTATHRERLGEIIDFINQASGGEKVVFPMHPRIKKAYAEADRKFANNVMLTDAVGHLDMVSLVKNARVLFTDSGGLQKEAYWLRVPCVTLRESTEWTETVDCGWNILYRDYRGKHEPVPGEPLAYGDGHTAERLLALLEALF